MPQVPPSTRTAVIVGASSGIGEAIARELHRDGWRLGLLARRGDRLEAIRQTLAADTIVRQIDVGTDEIGTVLGELFGALGDVDLVIVSAGTGHLNPDLALAAEIDTLTVNVLGFMKTAQAAMQYFLRRGRGHLVGITSVAALRGNGVAPAYAASKAFQSVYLDGLRELAGNHRIPIVITEAQPGFVDTAMMKTPQPLSALARWLLVSSPSTAARQIVQAIRRQSKHVYVTRRYVLIAWVVRRLPRPG